MSRKYLADKIPVEENFFLQTYVDITQKCNMNCNTCYSPNREGEDVDLNYFEDVCKKLPIKVAWRVIGGEPTVSDKLIPLLQIIDKYGHFGIVVSNGLKLSDKEYCKEIINNVNSNFIISISFDGVDDDEIYKQISGRECAEFKMKALQNLIDVGFKKTALTMTVIRGINEHKMKRLYEIVKEKNVRYIHYRSQVSIGRFLDEEKPYSIKELKDLCRKFIPNIDKPYKEIDDNYKSPPQYKCCGECERFWLEKDLQISLIGFGTDRSLNCVMRGYLNDDYTFTSLFRNIRNKNGAYEIK